MDNINTMGTRSGNPLINARKCFLNLGLLFVLLTLSFQGKAQIFPVQSSTQLVPPYSVYLSDYATPGNEKLRVILVQRDLTQPSYQLRLVMQVEWNGKVIMRTSRSYNPPPISLDPGVPTIISGIELFPYLDSRNIDFVGYSREQYERTKALPEGSYHISFTAYDYRRQDVQVSNEGSSFYYLSKNEPPLINLPVCGAKVPVRQPQQVIFSWLPRNTSSPASAGGTQYEFSLYEIRPEGRNPNDVVLSSQPVFKTTIDYTQLVYGLAEPQLIEDMRYAWRVRAIDTQGRDAFRNNGYSEVCTFTYGGVDPAFIVGGIADLQAEGESERSARIWWEKGNFDSYRIYYKKSGQGHEWFTSDLLAKDLDPAKEEGELKLFDLEPDTEYETRAQAKKMGSPGPYTDIIKFRTLPIRVAHCGDPALLPEGGPGEPFREAIKGMAIGVDGMEMTLLDVVHLGDGWYKGLGRVSVDYLGGAAFTASFDRIFINTDRQVVLGRIDFVTNGVAVMAEEQLAAQEKRKGEREAESLAVNGNGNEGKDIIFEGVIDSVFVDEKGEIVIIDTEGERFVYGQPVDPATGAVLPVNIVDGGGNGYVVDGEGKVGRGDSGWNEGLTSGSITENTSYPFKQFVILGYNGQVAKDKWYYCTPKALSATHQALFEENIIRLRKGYSGVMYGQLQFDTDCEVDYSPDMTIKAEYFYHGSADAKFYIAKWDEKYDIKWLLNDSEIADPNSMEDKLKIGSNALELHVRPKEGGNYQSYVSLTINYATSDLSLFRVKVYRKGEEKEYEHDKRLGDTGEGERPLEIGEKVKMQLLQSDGQGSWQVIENPVWEIGDKSLITQEFELEADAFMAMLSIRKEGLFSGTFNLHLSVERNIGEITYADNKFKEINVNALDKESKKENRKSKYEKALEKIEEESSDLYNLFTGNQPALQVYVVPGSHSKIPSVKRGEKLYGLADAKEKFIKTSLLDIEYLASDLAGGVIKNTAKLVRKLDTDQIEQIKIAAEKKEMTALFTDIYNRIKEDDETLAEELKTKTLAGNYDETFTASISYELKTEEAREFITVGQEQMEIYLNDDAVGTNQSSFNRTLAHELRHLEQAYNHPYNRLKWYIIRKRSDNETKYKLGDNINENKSPDCNKMCSALDGHEMYNPENCEVCTEESKY